MAVEPENLGGMPVQAVMSDRIGVTAPIETVAVYQLAARWAERYADSGPDNLPAMLERFRRAYVFLDAVTHGLEPPSE